MKMVPNSANHPRAGRDDPDRSGVWGVAADIPYISGSGGSVPDVQFTDESQSSSNDRVKTRVIMGSSGRSIWEARTVKDILMAVFDVLEGNVDNSMDLLPNIFTKMTQSYEHCA